MAWYEIIRIIAEVLMAIFAAKPAANTTGQFVRYLRKG